MLQRLFHNLYKANVESISEPEYECHSCGRYEPTGKLEDRIINDQGELQAIVVCKRCIAHGWDEWRRD